MKVLLLTDFYPPVHGGMPRHCFLLANALRHRGLEVIVFTSGYENMPEKTEENGVTVIRFDGFFQRLPFLFKDSKMKHHPPIQDYAIVRELRNLVQTEQPDLMHSHGWILNSAVPVKTTAKIPLIHTLHEYSLLCPKKTLITENGICESPLTMACVQCSKTSYGGFAKAAFSTIGVKNSLRILSRVDKFVAVSSFVKQVYLRHLRLSENDIVVIPNFYEKETFKTDFSIGLPNDFILFVGALIPEKGIDVLLDAYKQLQMKTQLVLMGIDTPDCRYTGSKNVLIHKNPSREHILQAYSKCKFIVVPSIVPETFGQVLLEAMAFKKAVIASDIGAIGDIVKNNETGLLVEPRNSKLLAEATKFLLDNPDVAEKMGAQGYERYVSLFSEEKVMPMVEQLYTNVISSFNRGK